MKMAVSKMKSKYTMASGKVQVQSAQHMEPKKFMGSLKGTASYVGDIVSPAAAADEWDVCRMGFRPTRRTR